jgi:hypothetical protein
MMKTEIPSATSVHCEIFISHSDTTYINPEYFPRSAILMLSIFKYSGMLHCILVQLCVFVDVSKDHISIMTQPNILEDLGLQWRCYKKLKFSNLKCTKTASLKF